MTRALVVPALVVLVAVIGIIDAATGQAWDLVTLFAAVGVLGALLAVPVRRRRPLTLRIDLFRFLTERADAGDESVGRIADRAVAAYRAALTGDIDPTPSSQ
ncbi:hypothetical protein JGU71_20450 [Antrihabitans sp. YC3-6]|uniref:Uncharacterized protein n=1 Tax=Antrihabitans stalagmiti TaxID=2799499 RepID=A0A934NTK3_9NOCA|nr:hypothetical protein [Antrihabitans stalagmiti]MBJ8341259.1 hypothetical protein [Antrihabitans stalagmiti]